MTIITAITGGIGSGKSTFSKVIKKRGLPLLDSDHIVAQIYIKPKKNFLSYLKKIGLGASINNNKINKKLISNIIFSNNKIKSKLEKYIYKITKKERIKFINKEKRKKTKIIFLDIPLLFENNLDNEFDLIISIISTKKERYKRLKISRKITKDLFQKIVKKQTTDIERKKNLI